MGLILHIKYLISCNSYAEFTNHIKLISLYYFYYLKYRILKSWMIKNNMVRTN